METNTLRETSGVIRYEHLQFSTSVRNIDCAMLHCANVKINVLLLTTWSFI